MDSGTARAGCIAFFTLALGVGCGASSQPIADGRSSPSNAGARKPSVGTLEPIAFERVGSPIVLARAGHKTYAFVADSDDATLHTVDVDEHREISTIPLAEAPSELLLTSDGRLITLFRNASRMQAFRVHAPDRLEPAEQKNVPTEPVALALSTDEKTLFVTSAFARTLSVFRSADLAPLWLRRLEREPWDMALSDDGSKLFVSHAVGGRLSVVALADPNAPPRVVRIASTQELSLREAMVRSAKAVSPAKRAAFTPPERVGAQNFSLAKSAALQGRILIPGVLVDPGNREVASNGYGDVPLTELSNVAVLDADRAELLLASVDSSVPITTSFGWGETAQQCLLPRAATVDPATGTLLVACLGLGVVMGFDGAAADPRRAITRSWSVAKDPIGIAVDAERRRALVWSQQERTITVIDLDDSSATGSSSDYIELSRRARHEKADLSLGRALFHATSDRRISADGRGCASCHVDGRDDGLTWATPGGPRQTLTLAGRLRDTAPFGWDGLGTDLSSHLSHTFNRLRGSGISDRETAALMAYVESLRQPEHSTDENADERARGQSVFASPQTGCANCHSGPQFTDGLLHDVGSRASADKEGSFNTPSLIGVEVSAPYFHDGRFSSLEELLDATDGQMGNTKQLSRSDRAALIAYLESL